MPNVPDPRAVVIFQCPITMHEQLHALARREGETAASILRRMVGETLRANGMSVHAPMQITPVQGAMAG